MNDSIRIERLDLSAIDDSTIAAFSVYTQPKYQCCFHLRHPQGIEGAEIIAIAAFCKEEPVGLILASFIPTLRFAELHSLSIAEPYRHQKIGSELIAALERELKQKGGMFITFAYPTNNPEASQFEAIFEHMHWAKPKLFTIECHCDSTRFSPPWFQSPLPWPEGFEPFYWRDLTQKERYQLQFQETQGLFESPISPFGKKESLVDLSTSLGLRYRDEVIGWVITHRIGDDAIKYASFYVQLEYQKLGVAIRMLADAIALQMKEKILWGIFEVNVGQVDASWLNFVKRRLVPFAAEVIYTNQTWKKIE